MNVCPKCGLVKELCVCEVIAKGEQRVTVSTVNRKFGKTITVIKGIDPKSIDIKDVARKMKSKFACGGTVKNNIIELQGDHKQKVKEALIGIGFSAESIDLS